MNKEQILKMLKEANIEPLSVEKAVEILDKEGLDASEFEYDPIREIELKTIYDTYRCYGNYDYAIISAEEYKRYLKDLAEEFVQQLPDKFDIYFDTEALAKDMLDNVAVLVQTQKFIEDRGETVTSITKVAPTFNDCYLLEIL